MRERWTPVGDSAPSGFRRGLRQLLQVVVLLLMTALAVVVVVGVGFRKAGAALVWYDEAASILLAWLTFYGACLAALEHARSGTTRRRRSCSPG